MLTGTQHLPKPLCCRYVFYKTAWEIWKMFEDLTPALLLVTSDLSNISDGVVATMEGFTIHLFHFVTAHGQLHSSSG